MGEITFNRTEHSLGTVALFKKQNVWELNMGNPLLKKLNGYQKAYRARFNLLTDVKFKLTAEEFVLYEFLIAITDWDETHIETYGSFGASDKDIAELLNWKSSSTVNRWRRRLITKKILREHNEDRFKVTGFEKWRLRKGGFKDEGNSLFLHSENAKTHTSVAEIDKEQAQTSDYSLVSSKVQSNDVLSEKLSDDEISQVILEIDNKKLGSEIGALQKEFSMNTNEQLDLAKSIFGEGTKWVDEEQV